MLQISEQQLLLWLSAWLWPFMRVSAFVMTAPVIGTKALPRRVRLVFALALTTVLVPLEATAVPAVPLLSGPGLVIGVQQLLVGAALGLILRAVFMVLEFAGQVVAQQMGLGFAAMVDPTSGTQVPVVAQFYIVLGTLMFFAFDAHLQLVRLLQESFRILPLGGGLPGREGLDYVIQWTGHLLSAGLLLLLPAIAALLIVNLAFGVIARSAPQFNIFSIGFPVMILFGLVVLVFTIGFLTEHVAALFEDGFGAATRFLQAR